MDPKVFIETNFGKRRKSPHLFLPIDPHTGVAYVTRARPHPQTPSWSLGWSPASVGLSFHPELAGPFVCLFTQWRHLTLTDARLAQPPFPQIFLQNRSQKSGKFFGSTCHCECTCAQNRDTKTVTLMTIRPEGLPCPQVTMRQLREGSWFPSWVQWKETWD